MTKEQLEAQNKELKKELAAVHEKLACVNAEADKCHAVMQDLYKRNSADVYGRAVTYYGESSRLLLTIEEMSELIKELCKDLRERGNVENIAEEVADVEITLAQIKKIYKIFNIGSYNFNIIFISYNLSIMIGANHLSKIFICNKISKNLSTIHNLFNIKL